MARWILGTPVLHNPVYCVFFAEEIRKPAQPLALRLSGQLLLGITRIYYKKVTLLLDDGKQAVERLKEFFRPGQVDMAETAGGANAVTLAEDALVDDAQQYDNIALP